MPRKRWTAKTETTAEILKFREKRKWQIALRRYVLDKNPSVFYAPYFGLDIENFRKWFEIQFEIDVGWDDFGKKWQFDHIIPVTYFDFSKESELKICWNFTNIRVEQLQRNKDRGNGLDVFAAKGYFEELFKKTLYPPCLLLHKKIEAIELSDILSSEKQQQFINENRAYLEMIETYSVFEFELLNSGREIEAVKKEIEFFRKMGK
ncbi:MAG TPA: hypothetical protein VK588_06655 [Chitinophagaceae bacterium]|nr:hypothetical protein [Chitinophagaceae bacterium]